MDQIFYLVGIIVLMFFASRVMSKVKPANGEKKGKIFPAREIANDKLIVVENVEQEQLEMVLKAFCKMYNDDAYTVLPRLITLSGKQFGITFPYDDHLEVVCYLVNYLNYPVETRWNAEVTAWATVTQEESFNDVNLTGKRIKMFCFADGQNGCDNVHIVTDDNAAFQINLDSTIKPLETSVVSYTEPVLQVLDLREMKFLDFN